MSERRTVEVPLVRLARWLDGFAERHGAWSAQPVSAGGVNGISDLGAASTSDRSGGDRSSGDRSSGDQSSGNRAPRWVVSAADGSVATVHGPAWLADLPGESERADVAASLDPERLSQLSPVFGAILLRRAGYVVALFQGRDLVERKIATRHIHGRTAAGGWSQQRYARRRANQADEIVAACAASAALLLARPHRAAVQFLVTGGDRPLVAAALDQLPPVLATMPVAAHLPVGTADRRALADLPDRVLAVSIEIAEAG